MKQKVFLQRKIKELLPEGGGMNAGGKTNKWPQQLPSSSPSFGQTDHLETEMQRETWSSSLRKEHLTARPARPLISLVIIPGLPHLCRLILRMTLAASSRCASFHPGFILPGRHGGSPAAFLQPRRSDDDDSRALGSSFWHPATLLQTLLSRGSKQVCCDPHPLLIAPAYRRAHHRGLWKWMGLGVSRDCAWEISQFC